MTEALDRRLMAAAIRLGAGALGSTWPNPAVGAILVKDGRVVGRARTGRGGRPHAETLALEMAGESARGATLYVSLEPCAHHGQTPPCADAIVRAKVGRVVTTTIDPDPRVEGKGLARLRGAGIDVMAALMTGQARMAHAGHLMRTMHGRPYVTLKLAVSADDAIGRRGEPQVPVTGVIARRQVQALRSRFDAILVGSGTVAADDPQLTCRLPGLEERSPVRVVLDSEGALSEGWRVFQGQTPTWVFVASEAPSSVASGSASLGRAREAEAAQGASRRRRLSVRRKDGGLDLTACLERLAEEGLTSVLVEGGARVARSFLEADLVDAAMLFRSPEPLGGDPIPALAGLSLSAIEGSERFRRTRRRWFGQDRMCFYERVR